MLFNVSVSPTAWKKYNKRRADISSYSWFGLSNNFIRDPEFFDLDPVEKLTIIYVFSEISEKNKTDIVIHSELMASTLRISNEKAITSLQRINGLATFTTHRKGELKVAPDPSSAKKDDSARLNIHTDIQTDKQTNKEPSESPPPPPKFSEEDLDLATRWLGALFLGKGRVSKEKAAETLRQCREIDGFTHEDLEAVFEFVRDSAFWSQTAQSPAGLRVKSKSYPDLTKIQVITGQMEKAKPRYISAEDAGYTRVGE